MAWTRGARGQAARRRSTRTDGDTALSTKRRTTSFTSSTASTAAAGPGPSTAASRSKAKARTTRKLNGRHDVIIVDHNDERDGAGARGADDEEWQDHSAASGSVSDGSDEVQVISRTPRPRTARRHAEDADDERDGEAVRRRSSGLRHTPARRAKKRAIKAIRVLDDDVDVNMDAPESTVLEVSDVDGESAFRWLWTSTPG